MIGIVLIFLLLLMAIFLLIFVFNTTKIEQERLRKEEEKRKRQEAYEKIDQLGGIQYIKQQLRTKSADEIAQRHNINSSYLNKYCRKHNTTIDKLINEILEQERLRKKKKKEKDKKHMKKSTN